MTVREIQGHLCELYSVDVSPDLFSRVTDAVLDEVREWRNRPLDAVYPVVFFDALRVKIRDESVVKNKPVYLALALNCEGQKHVLGIWIEQTEAAKFWWRVMNEFKTRGVDDIIFAVFDGLKDFPDAITTVFPRTIVRTCIVHLIRDSLERLGVRRHSRCVDRRHYDTDIGNLLGVATVAANHADHLGVDRFREFEAEDADSHYWLPNRIMRLARSGCDHEVDNRSSPPVRP
jgi:hypothetical protein